MKDVYIEGLNRVSIGMGVNFKVDIRKRDLIVGKQYLIKDGVCADGYSVSASDGDMPTLLNELEKKYVLYKHSVPNANEPRRPIFKALPFEKLSPDDIDFGMKRDICRFCLETTLLIAIINGDLSFGNSIMGNGWFWKSPVDHDFVILRSWIEPSNK